MNETVASMPADPREEQVRSILIVGGGSSGWMAAMYLATVTPRDTTISLVESDAIGIIGVGEATIPPIQKFNRRIQLDEREFMKATQASFKFGVEFRNWGRAGDRYIHQFGRVARELDALVPLHNWWLLGQRAGGAEYPAWGDMFIAVAAAHGNRFAKPDRDLSKPASRFTYAYQFDAHLYAKHLRRLSEARGIERVEGRITGVERATDSENLAAVVLEDGTRLEADLFIDCSGFRSLLLGGELGEPFLDWSEWLAADRALAVPSERSPNGITPYTRATAHEVGWQWRIPLQHRTGNGHVFSSQFSTEGEAEQRLLAHLDTRALASPMLLKFATGMRRRHWVGNVVALGLSAGFLEPIESTSIHFVQASLERLVELFPTRRMDPQLRDRFNELTSADWERVRDFIIAHYHLNQRGDSEFWRHMAAMRIPDSLRETLDLWKARGVLGVHGGHLFQIGSWSSVLIGQNYLPEGMHALASRADPEYAAQEIRRIANEAQHIASAMPLHDDFLAQYCRAEPIEAAA